MKRYCYWMMVCFCLAAGAFLSGCDAQDAGEKAYQKGDYTKALAKLSKSDTPKSAYYLGLMYTKGNGVPQDVNEAARLLLKAASTTEASTTSRRSGATTAARSHHLHPLRTASS